MSKLIDYAGVLEVLKGVDEIAICGHINPDGDCIGSMLALRELLRALGKEPTCLLNQGIPAPATYDFLPDYSFKQGGDYGRAPQLLVVVDVSVLNRLGDTMPVFGHADQTLIIDHHDGYDGLGSYALVDPDAAACSLLIWNLILASGVAPTARMAEYCYLGLMTDTGRFAYQNTSAACFTAAAQMVQAGAQPERMYARIYSNKPLAVLQLESRLLERMQLACDGAVASSYLSDADLSELGIVREQTEELPSFLRSIEGVRVSALFRSQSDGVRVNLRSEDGFNVGDFAQRFGGGGHPGAAGISLSLPFEEAMEQIVAALIQDYSTH